ncbi:dTDP-4-dehydrorhamnose 3,5-epimerase family protein [Paenibacillus filicis]|uniref:dTDP-4-dehydrorhamnose 3,5-epimerase family protein n=1 Tax=Paenibacillus gyeongsangnamensis TaxID=3388067 RepID=A0ABT4QA28_9BACL|nr:dTDP-4-dehydrorhamnose 3,5-epimerase family protein [Paenibacillus filicis]MCZ8513607.1 dTDP-4-dehydrorhamnose 3,5-epimerase family protein [Paenibacillus filicis]
MIQGVQKKQLVKHADDRGYFMELLREDDPIFGRFGQASMSASFPGVIKAFHYHKLQDDIWFFPSGYAQVVLHDMRPDSPTYRQTDVYYMNEETPYLLFIPRGVAHGYRVLGTTPATIVYFTNMAYDPQQPDEYRLAYDDPSIGFDWTTKFR